MGDTKVSGEWSRWILVGSNMKRDEEEAVELEAWRCTQGW